MASLFKAKTRFTLFFLVVLPVLALPAFAASDIVSTSFAAEAKTLNAFRQTTGANPEVLENPAAASEAKENLFSSMERVRFKPRVTVKLPMNHRLITALEYDHQATFGSFVSSGDFRLNKFLSERRQFIDLSQTLVEKENAFYEHRLYRASFNYSIPEYGSVEVGRQLIPWGVGRFFMPTDLFNPFDPLQLEPFERDGVDAVHFKSVRFHDWKGEFVFTPRGKSLHPNRYLGRVSHDIYGYEAGVLGGRVGKDHAVGLDLSGNLKDAAVRGEVLYREVDKEKDFLKFTLNADYNFPYNIYALLEYHFNGEGRHDTDDYQRTRFLRGEIQQLARNYLALNLGYDLTNLIRLESNLIFNLDDASLFIQPEIQYEIKRNWLLTAKAQLFAGGSQSEFGAPDHLYLGELKYSY